MWPQISLFISGVVSLALLPLITPLLYYLPKPALSIVVIFAVAKVRPSLYATQCTDGRFSL